MTEVTRGSVSKGEKNVPRGNKLSALSPDKIFSLIPLFYFLQQIALDLPFDVRVINSATILTNNFSYLFVPGLSTVVLMTF